MNQVISDIPGTNLLIDVRNAAIGWQFVCIQELQRRSGCRVSEVLIVRNIDIIDQEHIYIHGSKGSNDRILFCPDIVEIIFKNILMDKTRKVFSVSYHQYYRFLKKRINPIKRIGKKNALVTHIFRHQLVNKIDRSNCTHQEKIGHTIGHRSKKTIRYYLERSKNG